MKDTADTAGGVVVVFGGRSEIGVELATRLAPGSTVVLAARTADRLDDQVAAVRAAGAGAVHTVEFDADDLASHGPLVDKLVGEYGAIGTAVLAFGILGDQSDIEPLRQRLDDAPTPLIRGYVVNALACLGDPEGLAQMARDLDSEDPAIRTYAATFAGDAKAVSTQAKLEAMLDDSFADARVRAAQTLLQLSR